MQKSSNKSSAIHSNIEFNVELDEKMLRINTEGGGDILKKSKGSEETDIESDMRHQLNINSPHGIETTNRILFKSSNKLEEDEKK
jgi:hypothetical protein